MRHLHLLLLMVGVVFASTRSPADDQGPPQLTRDGSSFERAIIVNVPEPKRTDWEMSQAFQRHPELGFLPDSQRTELPHLGRLYHIWELRSKTGKRAIIYFDLGEDELPRPNQAMQVTATRVYV